MTSKSKSKRHSDENHDLGILYDHDAAVVTDLVRLLGSMRGRERVEEDFGYIDVPHLKMT